MADKKENKCVGKKTQNIGGVLGMKFKRKQMCGKNYTDYRCRSGYQIP